MICTDVLFEVNGGIATLRLNDPERFTTLTFGTCLDLDAIAAARRGSG